MFTNFDGESPQALVQNLLRVAYGVAPGCPGCHGHAGRGAPSLSPADRDAIVGNYTLQLPGGQALPIKFFLDGARLMAQAQGQDANEIRYLGNYTFGVAFDPALRFTFTFDARQGHQADPAAGRRHDRGAESPVKSHGSAIHAGHHPPRVARDE